MEKLCKLFVSSPAFPIIIITLFLVLGSGCTLNSTFAVMDLNNQNPKTTPSIPEISEGPDMIVIGQPNWLSVNIDNTYDPRSTNLAYPRGIIKVDNKYFVADYYNNRILVFENSISSVPAFVLGQPNFTSGIINNNGGFHEVTARGLQNPTQIATDGTKLAVVDRTNNRVLIWNSIPSTTFQPADVVIGQPDFSKRNRNQGEVSPTAASLDLPTGVAFVGSKLVVSDQNNNRLLVFNSVPTSNGALADVVIGQSVFTSSAINRTGSTTIPSSVSLYSPYYLHTDGTRLFVSDGYNNRVLVWNSVPTLPDVPADLVLGQATFTTNAAATSQVGLKQPRHAIIVNNSLYIADANNNRIVYHASMPSSNGAAATSVFGQSLFTLGTANRALYSPASNSMSLPSLLAVLDGNLWVADGSNNRLLKFLSPPTPVDIASGAAVMADDSWGQPTLTTGYMNQVVSPNKNGFGRINGVCADSQWLIAADPGNQRFLVFDRNNPTSGAISAIGQTNSYSNLANQGAALPTAKTLSINSSGLDPACAFDSRGRLYISDNMNNRVLVWNQTPLTSGVSADFVFGQANFTTATAQGCTATGLNRPTGLVVVDDKLVVTDYGNNRSLIFDVSSTTLDRTADLVIGASNFTSCSGGTSSTLLKLPWSVTWDGTRLYIVDFGNSRVMIYNSFPAADGISADFVIGQPDFTSVLSGPTASLFLKTSSGGVRSTVAVLDGFLLVPDYSGQRVLAFELAQLANGMSASFQFNQPNMTTGIGTVFPGNATNTAFDQFWLAMGIHNFADDDFIWISDQVRLIRVKKSKFFKYAR
jgi:hypothetical protein